MSISVPRRLSAAATAAAGATTRTVPARAARRVRHEVRDGVAVIAFSAAASTGLATAMLLLVKLVGRTA